MICFDVFELRNLFDTYQKDILREEIKNSGYSYDELLHNESLRDKITQSKSEKLMGNNDMIEVFVPLFSFIYHFDGGSKICFPLERSFVFSTEDPFTGFEHLLESIEKATDIDFSISSSDGVRQFQLKRYLRGELTTDSLYEFILEMMKGYGNDLGDTNLLVLLGVGGNLDNVSFEELKDKLSKTDIKSTGEILITYNENNTHDAIYSVYPEILYKRIKRR